MFLRHLCMFVVVFAAALTAGTASGDNGVTVYAGPNSTCGIGGFGGQYTGVASAVIFTADGAVKHTNCTAFLVSGTPVAHTEVIQQNGCTWVFTPGRTATVVCPQGF
jgi:hypothetical protein